MQATSNANHKPYVYPAICSLWYFAACASCTSLCPCAPTVLKSCASVVCPTSANTVLISMLAVTSPAVRRAPCLSTRCVTMLSVCASVLPSSHVSLPLVLQRLAHNLFHSLSIAADSCACALPQTYRIHFSSVVSRVSLRCGPPYALNHLPRTLSMSRRPAAMQLAAHNANADMFWDPLSVQADVRSHQRRFSSLGGPLRWVFAASL